jgi:hypothetical protein
MAALRHKNVVTVHDVGYRGSSLLAMQLVRATMRRLPAQALD